MLASRLGIRSLGASGSAGVALPAAGAAWVRVHACAQGGELGAPLRVAVPRRGRVCERRRGRSAQPRRRAAWVI